MAAAGDSGQGENLDALQQSQLIQCIGANCEKMLTFDELKVHLKEHFIEPNYDNRLLTTVCIYSNDFRQSEPMTYGPKWLHTYGYDFFFTLMRKTDSTWVAWVSLVGSELDAALFVTQIHFSKNHQCLGGTYPVTSICRNGIEVEADGKCFVVDDGTITKFSNIGDNFLTSVDVRVKIDFKVDPEMTINPPELVPFLEVFTECSPENSISENEESEDEEIDTTLTPTCSQPLLSKKDFEALEIDSEVILD